LQDLNPGKTRFVLNTHHHGDHVGGNAFFAEKGATIIAHHNVRTRLAQDGKSKETLPVITFAESASVHFNGQEIKLYHAGAGHTDGDSIVYFTASNVIHMGDLFFNGAFPFVDLRNGGSVAGYVKTVGTVLEKVPANAKIIPGHGELADVNDLREFYAMLVETTRLVRDEKAGGKSLDQVKSAGMPDKYAEWGSGFISTDRWIETIYSDSE
jgi:glyoxylase-like metal-dependent hydrolase (beta-lactamase superfamily II)